MTATAPALRILALVALAGLAACTAQFRNHGYVPTAGQLERIDVGASRDDVATFIGRPSATGLLSDDGWFYVRSRYRDYAWRPPVEIDREVVVVSFADDSVANIERFGLREGRVVPISRRVTDRNTAGIPLLRQLFGNLGNFDPGTLLGDE